MAELTASDLPTVHQECESSYGAHTFTLSDNRTRVTAVSEPTWDRFVQALNSLRDPGEYILSPEQITTAGGGWAVQSDRAERTVNSRIGDVRDISTRFPGSLIVLGSTLYNTHYPKNGQVLIHNGGETGRSPRFEYASIGTHMGRSAFYQAVRLDHAQPDRATAAMVSADAALSHWKLNFTRAVSGQPMPVYSGVLKREVETLLISGNWAQTLLDIPASSLHAGHFTTPLMLAAKSLFAQYANLREIIMADRSSKANYGPFNIFCQRQDPGVQFMNPATPTFAV